MGSSTSPLPIARLFALTVLGLICFLFARSWLQLELEADGTLTVLAENLSWLVTVPVLLLFLTPVFRTDGARIRQLFATDGLTPRYVAIGITIGGLWQLAFWGKVAFLGALSATVRPSGIYGFWTEFACPPALVLFSYLLVHGCLVPIVEEIVHRGWFVSWLSKFSSTAAVLGSACLFMMFHDFATYPMAFVIGIVLAVLLIRTNTLWPGLIAHVIYNASFALTWYCRPTQWFPDPADERLLGIGSIGFMVAVAAFAGSLLLALKAPVTRDNVLDGRPDGSTGG